MKPNETEVDDCDDREPRVRTETCLCCYREHQRYGCSWCDACLGHWEGQQLAEAELTSG